MSGLKVLVTADFIRDVDRLRSVAGLGGRGHRSTLYKRLFGALKPGVAVHGQVTVGVTEEPHCCLGN